MSHKKNRSRLQQSCVDIFAGTIAGINVTLVGHPFDTLKIRLQTQPQDKPVYSGLIDCFQKTIKWEGISGLYKGVASPIVGQMFFRAILFWAYGESKRILSNNNTKKLENYQYFIAGGIAWTFGALAECPIDFFKTQMQIQIIKSKVNPSFVPEYTSTKDCFQKIIKMNGWKGAYQGFLAHIMRNLPCGASHLGMFEVTRLHYAKKYNCKVTEIPISKTLIAGAIGGWCYWFFYFPLDVVKSSIQSDSPINEKKKFNGVLDVYRKLYDEGGYKRFFKGFSPCLLRAIPANAILLLTSSYLSENL